MDNEKTIGILEDLLKQKDTFSTADNENDKFATNVEAVNTCFIENKIKELKENQEILEEEQLNKYLKSYNKIIKMLKQDYNVEYGFEVFYKIRIALEVDNLLEELPFGNDMQLELTTEQEEKLIDIIYDIYMSTDDTLTEFECSKAVFKTIENDFGNNFVEFDANYETKYQETFDKIIYKF